MKLFSIYQENNHKVFNFLGIKFKKRSFTIFSKNIQKNLTNIKDAQQVFNYQIMNKIKESELKAKIKEGKKVKVFFLIAQPSKFGMETVYEAMMESDLFEPYIYSVYYDKNTSLDKNLQKQCDINYSYWKERGYRVINGYDENYNPIPLYEHEPDIIFITDPVMFGFSSFKNHIFNWHYLTCYVPYGLSIMEDVPYHFNFMSINEMWKVFAPTRFDYKSFINKSLTYGLNAVYFGYPEFDSYDKKINENQIPQKINNDKPTVIYAPHWSIKDYGRNNISTFHLYSTYFLDLLKKYPEINFVFKPHPRLLPRLYDLIDDKTIMSPKEYQDYIDEWNSAPNGLVLGEVDYIELFKKSSALITDCGSFIGEYLYSHNPCIYLVNPELRHFGKTKSSYLEKYSEYGQDILKTYYICKNQKEIQDNFENVVIKNIDAKKEDREAVLKKYSDYIGTSGKSIVEYLNKILTH